ncbi:hypothetical protein C9374_009933 [Naegleria lovaniensis]|uniref:Uncharacterized protein n=1 Tax=Naegleria lovaniensis TaxID=51637 RepID=A0AA88GH01_NAELO|nr:uncharacterized protein C9374_009933 [Naegleria lovaniensis]KAG2375310.1 hypothetical protein C9374_009933 [Naegleria lovaniensis]
MRRFDVTNNSQRKNNIPVYEMFGQPRDSFPVYERFGLHENDSGNESPEAFQCNCGSYSRRKLTMHMLKQELEKVKSQVSQLMALLLVQTLIMIVLMVFADELKTAVGWSFDQNNSILSDEVQNSLNHTSSHTNPKILSTRKHYRPTRPNSKTNYILVTPYLETFKEPQHQLISFLNQEAEDRQLNVKFVTLNDLNSNEPKISHLVIPKVFTTERFEEDIQMYKIRQMKSHYKINTEPDVSVSIALVRNKYDMELNSVGSLIKKYLSDHTNEILTMFECVLQQTSELKGHFEPIIDDGDLLERSLEKFANNR